VILGRIKIPKLNPRIALVAIIIFFI